jgi:PleD family two-component response regulator
VTAGRILKAARGLGFEADGRSLQITLSIGISHYENENTLFFDSLVEAGQLALAQASEGGGDRFVYVDPGPQPASGR